MGWRRYNLRSLGVQRSWEKDWLNFKTYIKKHKTIREIHTWGRWGGETNWRAESGLNLKRQSVPQHRTHETRTPPSFYCIYYLGIGLVMRALDNFALSPRNGDRGSVSMREWVSTQKLNSPSSLHPVPVWTKRAKIFFLLPATNHWPEWQNTKMDKNSKTRSCFNPRASLKLLF